MFTLTSSEKTEGKKIQSSPGAYGISSVFSIKVSQRVLILLLRQETEAFTFNEAFL